MAGEDSQDNPGGVNRMDYVRQYLMSSSLTAPLLIGGGVCAGVCPGEYMS